jgi:hypothetical protein
MIEDAVEGTPGTAFEDVVTVRRRMHASPDGSFGVACACGTAMSW